MTMKKGLKVSNPISSNQVVDVDVEFECLEPECKNLNGVLLEIDKRICDLEKPKDIDFKCLNPKETQAEILQEIIDHVCGGSNNGGGGGSSGGGSTSPLSLNFDTLNLCTGDSWECDDAVCLTPFNLSNPASKTLQVLLQAMIAREISLSNEVKKLCTEVTTLKSRVTNLEAQLTIIQNNCCQ